MADFKGLRWAPYTVVFPGLSGESGCLCGRCPPTRTVQLPIYLHDGHRQSFAIPQRTERLPGQQAGVMTILLLPSTCWFFRPQPSVKTPWFSQPGGFVQLGKSDPCSSPNFAGLGSSFSSTQLSEGLDTEEKEIYLQKV